MLVLVPQLREALVDPRLFLSPSPSLLAYSLLSQGDNFGSHL